MIKTAITKHPTTREIEMLCPSCKGVIRRIVKARQQKGKEECFVCHTQFGWKEIKGGN